MSPTASVPTAPALRTLGAELRQGQRGAPGRARGGDPDLLDQLAPLALGDSLHRPHQHVEHVHAHRHGAHLGAHSSSRAGCGEPYPRSSTASTTATRWSSSRVCGLADRAGAPVDGARPFEQERALERGLEVGGVDDGAVVGHEGRGPSLERLRDGVGELRGAEGLVRRDPHRAAEEQHRVVNAGQLIEHAGERRRHRRMGVDDGARVEALVEAQVQPELGGRLAAVPRPAAPSGRRPRPARARARPAGRRSASPPPARCAAALTLPAVPSTSPSAASRRAAAATASRSPESFI